MPKLAILFLCLMTFSFFICISVCIHIGHTRATPDVLKLLDDLICRKHECSASHNSKDSLQWRSEDYVYIQSELETHESGLIPFDHYDVFFWWKVDGDVIVMIQSKTDSGLVSLGNLLAFYGRPCSVTFTEDNINLQYPDFYASIKAEYDLTNPDTLYTSVSPSMRVESINLPNKNVTCETPVTFATSQNIIREWRGLGNIEFYISQTDR